MKLCIRVVIILIFVPCMVFAMDDVEAGIVALEAGESSCSGRTLDAEHDQLANKARACAQYRGGSVDDEASTEVDEPPVQSKPAPKKRNRKRVKQLRTVRTDKREAGHVPGLDELEDGVGVVSQPSGELTIEQVNDVLCNRLHGKVWPEFGPHPFDMDDADQKEGMLGLLRMIRARDQITGSGQYESLVGSIVRGKPSRSQNKALIAVLGKVVSSIDSMNDDSSRLAAEANRIAIQGLQETIAANELTIKGQRRTEIRYRWGLVGTAFTTVVGPIIAAAVTYAATYISPEEITDLCDQMGNATMS